MEEKVREELHGGEEKGGEVEEEERENIMF